MAHERKPRTAGETTWVRTPANVKPGPSPRLLRGFAAAIATIRRSVWSPVLGKALGIVSGMLALAVIGALATARGLGKHESVLTEPSAPHSSAGPAALSPAGRHVAPVAAGMVPSEPVGSSSNSVPSPAPSEGVTADGKVILNRASLEDLRRLPGVGPKRAQAILDLRAKLGRFRRATDLLRIKGIGPKSLKRLQPHFVLDPPATPPTPSAMPTPE
jgi:competence protein ComEA